MEDSDTVLLGTLFALFVTPGGGTDIANLLRFVTILVLAIVLILAALDTLVGALVPDGILKMLFAVGLLLVGVMYVFVAIAGDPLNIVI